MLLGGDEYGRTQDGNNNAYCHDDDISWLGWKRDKNAQQLLSRTRRVSSGCDTTIRCSAGRSFSRAARFAGLEVKDIMWFNLGGVEMTDAEWHSNFDACAGDVAQWQGHRRAR